MTPSQTCPRPNGFGRNLRSKTRWFTGFCNSHQVSHFATFFIDARAEISVAESRCGYKCDVAHCTLTVSGTARERSLDHVPWRVWRRGFVVLPGEPAARACGHIPARGGPGRRTPCASIVSTKQVHGSCFSLGIDNDPSAGSPTETLLRLLLPLNDKVQWTSRDVAGGGPPTSPRSEHFTGPFNR